MVFFNLFLEEGAKDQVKVALPSISVDSSLLRQCVVSSWLMHCQLALVFVGQTLLPPECAACSSRL